jgi:predicted GTPase
VVGDGPTSTHGGMAYGAGTIAARQLGASEIISGREFAAGSISDAYSTYPHMEAEVPALGYSSEQLADLEATLNAADADIVLFATPVNLGQLINVNKPMVAVEYELEERGGELAGILGDFDYYKLSGG